MVEEILYEQLNLCICAPIINSNSKKNIVMTILIYFKNILL